MLQTNGEMDGQTEPNSLDTSASTGVKKAIQILTKELTKNKKCWTKKRLIFN